MKLLSPTETKDKRESYNLGLESKSATLDEAIVSKRNELLSMDEEFLRSMQDQRIARLEEDAEWQKRNDELKTETEELEQRKVKALLPLEEREKQIDYREEALSQREHNVSKQEQEAADNLALLEVRLDEASDRLQSVRNQEKDLEKRFEGVKLQERLTIERTNEFNEVLKNSLEQLETSRKEIAQLKAEQEGKETYLSEWQKRIDAKEKDLVSRETKLLDRYKMLERDMKEINSKKI